MSRARLDGLFASVRAANRPAFLPFMTVGLPDPGHSPGIFAALAAAGADGFEAGVPYSDPLMDGPVIQEGSDRALAAGADLETSFGTMAAVVAGTSVPTIAMTYANPVFRRGPDAFAGRLADAGVDGIIVPDLPVEECEPVRRAAERHGLGLVLFVAPTSDRERIEKVAAADPVFVYAVAEMGVTGEREKTASRYTETVERIREVTAAPVVFGVGISTPEQAREAGRVGDGVIVGSALVRRVLAAATPEEAARNVAAAAGEIAAALRTSRGPVPEAGLEPARAKPSGF